MRDLIQDNIEIVNYILPILSGLLIYFIQQFFSVKIRNRELLKSNKRIIEETEQIKSQFNKEIEEIKKDYQLEISRRKYQYESKKEQYINFFKILDTFTSINSEKTIEKITPIIDEFNRNFMTANSRSNKRLETQASVVFQRKLQKLMFESSEELRRIKGETNTIKLIASDSILEKLDYLEFLYDKALENSNKVINGLSQKIITNQSDQLSQDESELNIMAKIINQTKYDLITLMRKELREI